MHKSMRRFLPLLGLLTVLAPGLARGQELPGIEAYAAAVAALSAPYWAGPRVPWPVENDRAEVLDSARDLEVPLAVHRAPGVRPASMDAALRGLRRMREALVLRGFAPPPPDGDLGGGPELDAYLDPGLEQPYRIESDGPTPWSYLDGMIVHIRLDARLPAARLEACAAEAYADASLAALDPAEAPAWRRATATYLAWLVLGRFDGCTDDVAEAQRHPTRGPIVAELPDGGGALFLAMLAARHDRGDGAYVRETWSMARQRTWEGDELRASPDLWEALDTAARLSDTSLDRYVARFASERYLVGRDAHEASLPIPALADLDVTSAVPVAWRGSLGSLPMRTSVHDPRLEALGSAYARIDVRGAPPGTRLRIYLRGEGGIRWSLAALVFDESGRQIARTEAGVRDREPNAYLPVELPAGSREVVAVVTNLGGLRPDADVPNHDARTFHLIVDRASD